MRKGYITQRNEQKLNNRWLWEYYKQEGGKLNNPEEFLDMFYYHTTYMKINDEILEQKHNRDLSSFFSEMDKKFRLTTLWDKDGNFLRVIE